MPLYEYQCTQCGNRVEAIQKVSDPPLAECEACGGQLERLLSAPAIQFKGQGWYITDYARKKNGKKGASAEGGSEAGESAKSKSGSEAGTKSSPESSSSSSD